MLQSITLIILIILGDITMADTLQSLTKIFENRILRIPDYQRGYAWTGLQCAEFWNDLMNLQIGHFHYTGQISLKPFDKADNIKLGCDQWLLTRGCEAFYVIDGQQRLTTCMILISEILNLIEKITDTNHTPVTLGYRDINEIINQFICKKQPPYKHVITYLFSYEEDNPNTKYLEHYIYNKEYQGKPEENYYTRNLRKAKDFFHERLKELFTEQGLDGINNLFIKLTQQLKFNLYEFDNEYDVFITFETMNNRGKKLTDLELLKNRLIYLSTLYPDEEYAENEKQNLRKAINDTWKEIYLQIGRQTQTLSDDQFLKDHWIMYFTYTRNRGDDYIKYLLNKFSTKNIFEKQTFIAREEIQDTYTETPMDEEDNADVEDTQQMTKSKLSPDEIYQYISSLNKTVRYWCDTFFPKDNNELSDEEQVWLDKLNRIGIVYFRPLVTAILARSDISSDDKVRIFKAIERFIFIYFRMGHNYSTSYSSEFSKMARDVYHKEKDIETVITYINDITEKNLQYAIPNFITKMNKLFKDKSGFYSWSSLKYFLFEYEGSLVNGGIVKITDWSDFTSSQKDTVTIEHILPQTPTNAYWVQLYKQFTDEQKSILTGALGNLLPLSQRINSALQNDSFPDKKQSQDTKKRRGYVDGSHSEIEVAKQTHPDLDWTAEQIYKRSQKLLTFLEKRWALEFSEDEKTALIPLDFIHPENDKESENKADSETD